MKKLKAAIAILMLSACALPAVGGERQPMGTYSIVAYDPVTGDLGVAVQSRFLGVGAVVPYAKAGVGAIATQAYANTTYGPRGLELLDTGLAPEQVIAELTGKDDDRDRRQVGMVDARGRSFSYTGKSANDWRGGRYGPNYAVQGNILQSEAVVAGMEAAFLHTPGSLAEKLIAALELAEAAGGDSRGKQSAALLVVRARGGYARFNDRFIDIRVDDSPDPVAELKRIYALWERTFLISGRFNTAEDFDKAGKREAARVERERAVATLDGILAEKPDDAEVLNNAAWALATHNLHLDRALQLAQRAAKLAPEANYIRDTLAEAYFRNGDIDKAIEIEADLVRKEPSNADYARSLKRFRDAKKTAPSD
jgi:uncharacterized Ntn-hydrolase superfamily protein